MSSIEYTLDNKRYLVLSSSRRDIELEFFQLPEGAQVHKLVLKG